MNYEKRIPDIGLNFQSIVGVWKIWLKGFGRFFSNRLKKRESKEHDLIFKQLRLKKLQS
jgi:hypothetical protein